MVADQIMSRGVLNPRVIGALQKVPREEFVPKTLRDRAYEDAALPIRVQADHQSAVDGCTNE
ncbi:MAG: hypothetical protein VX970_05280 [Planctomycetota bacterium]|nr:hypothetical protein [Planctomycetota bacterium]